MSKEVFKGEYKEPSQEEVDKAAGKMTPKQREMSSSREEDYQHIEGFVQQEVVGFDDPWTALEREREHLQSLKEDERKRKAPAGQNLLALRHQIQRGEIHVHLFEKELKKIDPIEHAKIVLERMKTRLKEKNEEVEKIRQRIEKEKGTLPRYPRAGDFRSDEERLAHYEKQLHLIEEDIKLQEEKLHSLQEGQ